jgi:hypothetical protein
MKTKQSSKRKWKRGKKKLGNGLLVNSQRLKTYALTIVLGTNSLNVDFDLTVKEGDFPAEPVKDFEQIHQHTYREQKEEMENAIRILKMTDEEVVNTSYLQRSCSLSLISQLDRVIDSDLSQNLLKLLK